jgi:hypothetical protein
MHCKHGNKTFLHCQERRIGFAFILIMITLEFYPQLRVSMKKYSMWVFKVFMSMRLQHNCDIDKRLHELYLIAIFCNIKDRATAIFLNILRIYCVGICKRTIWWSKSHHDRNVAPIFLTKYESTLLLWWYKKVNSLFGLETLNIEGVQSACLGV